MPMVWPTPSSWPRLRGNDTRLVALMLANNETGCLQPVARLAELAAERGIPVHTDAVQAVGRIPVNFHALGVTTLAASAHKFHGPVGVGVLLVRRGVKLRSRLHGGGQQQGQTPRNSGRAPGGGPGYGPGTLAFQGPVANQRAG